MSCNKPDHTTSCQLFPEEITQKQYIYLQVSFSLLAIFQSDWFGIIWFCEYQFLRTSLLRQDHVSATLVQYRFWTIWSGLRHHREIRKLCAVLFSCKSNYLKYDVVLYFHFVFTLYNLPIYVFFNISDIFTLVRLYFCALADGQNCKNLTLQYCTGPGMDSDILGSVSQKTRGRAQCNFLNQWFSDAFGPRVWPMSCFWYFMIVYLFDYVMRMLKSNSEWLNMPENELKTSNPRKLHGRLLWHSIFL